MNWTDERVAEVKDLWAKGFSASQIAARLGDGVTRNAVIAKIHRLRIAKGSDAPVPRMYGGERPKPTRAPRPVANSFVKPTSVPKVVKPYVDRHDRVFDPIKLVTFAELDDKHCKWPVGDPRSDVFRFCGEPRVLGLPYCKACNEVARQPIRIDAGAVNLAAGGQIESGGHLGSSEKFPAAGEAPVLEMEDA